MSVAPSASPEPLFAPFGVEDHPPIAGRAVLSAEDRALVLAVNAVTAALLVGDDPDAVLRLTACEVRGLARAELAFVAFPAPAGVVVRAADGGGAEEMLGRVFPLLGSIPGRVFGSGRAESADALGQGPEDAALADGASAPCTTVPLWSEGRPVGILTVVRRPGGRSFSPTEVQRLQAFAAQVSFVLGCVRAGLERRHRAVVEDEERIAGQLNDQVIGHLFRVGLTLHSIRQAPGTSPESTVRLDGAIEELDDAIRALRACVFAGTMRAS